MNIRIAALALVGATVCGECPAEDFLHISHVHRGGKAMIWLGAWPKDHGAAERARADEWFRDAMAKLRAKDFKYIDVVSIHTYYDPKDPVDSFIPSTPLLREMVV